MRIALATMFVMASTPAHADGTFFEADVGLMTPLGDDDYEQTIDESLKLGVRLGSRSGSRGLDVSVDFTPANDELDSAIAEVGIQRFRFMAGGRYEHPITPKARFFVRGAAGVDLVRVTASGEFLGQEFDNSETDGGLALEISSGVLFDVGKVQLGAKLGIPFAFHFDATIRTIQTTRTSSTPASISTSPSCSTPRSNQSSSRLSDIEPASAATAKPRADRACRWRVAEARAPPRARAGVHEQGGRHARRRRPRDRDRAR